MSARRLLLGFTVAGIAIANLAAAQTRDEIRQQQEQLYEQQQQQAYPNPSAPPLGGGEGAPGPGGAGLTAQLLDRVSRLEDEVRTLRGRVDELQNQVQTQTAGLNKQIGDLNFAMQGHGAAPAPAPAPAPPPAYAPSPARPVAVPSAAPRLTPEGQLRQANSALARRDYPAAADLARQAVGTGGVHAAQAQYVLAEALAGEGNHGGAAAAYYGAYTKQPHGPFAGDALLHVGSSLIATGDDNAACEALGQLRTNFPSARPGLLKQAAVLRVRAHCH